MSNESKLGKTPTALRERDAVHVPIISATAAESMFPGTRVSITSDGMAFPSRIPIGVIDPFLDAPARAGHACWVCLFPGSIQSLRHEWTHGALDWEDSPQQIIAEIAADMSMSVDDLMAYARDHVGRLDGGYVVQDGDDTWTGGFDPDRFWPAYEAVVGEKVDPALRDHFFSCAC